MGKLRLGTLIIALFIPLIVGMMSSAISAKGMATYGTMSKPPLAPPAWLFPIAWTILYIMMGLASYFIVVAKVDGSLKTRALILYAVQLVMNFMWSIVFFNWGMYLFAFIWLIVMWALVILCAVSCYRISNIATFLLIPYIVWLTFAAYLNLGAYFLNMNGK